MKTVIATAVPVILAAAVWLCHPSPRHRLLDLSSEFRPTPGRLNGETVYRPWRANGRATVDPKTIRATLTVGNLAPIDSAVQDLLLGRSGRAIAKLKLAAKDSDAVPAALTDLSAAYLARFASDGDCLNLLRAVEAADRALSREPDNRTCRFNRATALSLLGARKLAAEAWRKVESEETGGWKNEATSQLRDLGRPTIEDEWKDALSRINALHASPAALTILANRFPANARAYAEEIVLPQWAAAVARDDQRAAEHWFRAASAIGAALASSRDEHLLADAVAAAQRTMEQGTAPQRRSLLEGLRKFGDGVALWNQQNLESAKRPLSVAVHDLGSIRNPIALWAAFYLATCEYYADATRGLAMLEDLLNAVRSDRYPALVGRAEWMAGTADKVQGRMQSSVHRYERAASSLRAAGGDPAAAFVYVLLAESYTLLGEHALAWDYRMRAFRTVPFSEGPRRNVAMWTEAKEALLRQGSLGLAGPLVDEAVAYAEIERKPLARAAAYLDRAVYDLSVPSGERARADLKAALMAIAEMERGPLRDQMASLALVTEGLCSRADRPAAAAALLRRGLAAQRATGTRFEEITYTTALADAEIAAGDMNAGADTLRNALSIFEEIRATVEDPVSRMQAFRQAQPAFDRLIDLQTRVLVADPEEPFQLSERSRARVLLETMSGKSGTASNGGFATLADLKTALPRGAALASYVLLNDRIVAWVVENGQARRLSMEARRATVEDAIEKFRLQLQRGGSTAAIREAAAPLYDLLIRPLALSADESLIIIPDRALARLPFAALYDRASRQYLIQQRAVTVAPSATLWLRASQSPHRARSKEISTLVIGVSESGSHRGTSLPNLPWVEEEARAVARVYKNSSLLHGVRATRGNYLRLSLSTDVVHFAGHAVVDLEAPRRSVLLFAGASQRTLEPLSLGELFDSVSGSAELVVLSACRTQDSTADDREGLLGLAGAFVANGVRAVVASPVDVDDGLAPPVMVAFHRQYARHRSAGTAFREAVLDLLRSRSDAASPAAWGGFTVIEGSLTNGGRE